LARIFGRFGKIIDVSIQLLQRNGKQVRAPLDNQAKT